MDGEEIRCCRGRGGVRERLSLAVMTFAFMVLMLSSIIYASNVIFLKNSCILHINTVTMSIYSRVCENAFVAHQEEFL